MSLKTRMALAVSVLVSGLLSAVGFAGLTYFQDQLKKSVTGQQFAMVSALAGRLDHELATSLREIAESAESIPPGVLRDPAEAQRFLDNRGKGDVRFDNSLVLLDREGRLLAESSPLQERRGQDLSFREYFKKVRSTGRPCISDPIISAKSRLPVIPLAAPVFAGNGELAAVLVGTSNLMGPSLLGKLSEIAFGRSGYLSLYAADGTAIMHPDKERILKKVAPAENDAILARALAGFEGSGERVNERGKAVLSSFKRLPSTNWVLVANYPLAEAYAPIATARRYLYGMLLLTALFSIPSAWLLMKRLTAPLIAFIGHVQELPNKEGEAKFAKIEARDEIGTLAEAFNTMVRELDMRQEEMRRLSLAVEQSPGSIVITDTEGTIEYVNPKFTQLTGYGREEAIGQNPRLLKSGETDPTVFTELWRAITSGKQWQGEFCNKRKNGELFWESARISPLIAANGRITHFMAIKEDITERKRAEEALRAERQKLYTLLDTIPGFVCLQAPDYSIPFANRFFRERFGETAGRLCYQIFEGRDRPCDQCPTFKVFETGELVTWNWTDKKSRTYQVFDYPFTDTDGSPLVLEMGIDVTEQKRNERELRKSRAELLIRHEEQKNLYLQMERKKEELEGAYGELKATQAQLLQNEKMASIGQLAAGVAHEINNPIGFVSSNLRTLDKYLARLTEFISLQKEQLDATSPPEALQGLADKRKSLKLDHVLDDTKSLISESLEGTERVRKIVADLKSFSRVDEADFKFADLNECLESTINIVWNEIKYKATLKKELGDIPQLKCYPQQLNQVFMNLLVNAAHAIEKQGEITVRSWREDGTLRVAVADNGCGIPEKIRTRIFEPFFTTKEVGNGTGLGLSISYDIVKKHGGEILVASEIGEGTTFTVVLPVGG